MARSYDALRRAGYNDEAAKRISGVKPPIKKTVKKVVVKKAVKKKAKKKKYK